MKAEYDFSQGERGKFYRQGLKLHLPIYLESEVLSYLEQRAAEKGIELNQLVNELLRRDIELVEAVR